MKESTASTSPPDCHETDGLAIACPTSAQGNSRRVTGMWKPRLELQVCTDFRALSIWTQPLVDVTVAAWCWNGCRKNCWNEGLMFWVSRSTKSFFILTLRLEVFTPAASPAVGSLWVAM